jgi:cation diffusion facilitator CzcD-associated flavoprotein CzcO
VTTQSPGHAFVPEDNVAKIRERYRIERLKRQRPAGLELYTDLPARMLRTRAEPAARALVSDVVTATVIGGGLSGLVAGAKLSETLSGPVRIVEKSSDFGGVWHRNNYPGAECDTAAIVYMPLLEETGYLPTRKYASGIEIRAYCRRVAGHFQLDRNALLETEVTALTWLPDQSMWLVETDRGDRFRSRFVILGLGQFQTPKIPKLEGIDDFEGHMFHTSEWDYGCTGGDPADAPMDRLKTRRVGVIGSGPSAIQCIPHFSRAARALFVFQRTPSAVNARGNQATPEHWRAQSRHPGWQRALMANYIQFRNPLIEVEDIVDDNWTQIAARIRSRLDAVPARDRTQEVLDRVQELADIDNMAELRERVAQIVQDPATARALQAWYPQFCKRPCFHDDYLEAFNRPNTHLIDTDGKGVTRLTRSGVTAAGRDFALDCIVFATGFRNTVGGPVQNNLTIRGRNGTLREAWADGVQSFQGVFVHGFPNLFVMQPVQGANFLSNITHNSVDAAVTVAAVVRHSQVIGGAEVEVSRDAQDRWLAQLRQGTRRLAMAECTPGIFNNDGDLSDPAVGWNVGYPGGPAEYFRYTAWWRGNGRFEGLTFRGGAGPGAADTTTVESSGHDS